MCKSRNWTGRENACQVKTLIDENYKRLRYCRYADDFVLGVIGSKEEAESIMKRVKKFLNDKLHLQVNEDKTKIRYAKDGTCFLGYHIGTYTDPKVVKRQIAGRYTRIRTISERFKLRVPMEKVKRFCQKNKYGPYDGRIQSRHRPELLNLSDAEIILTYNAEVRGFANYYSLAADVKTKLDKLFRIAHVSLFKTLAAKHKTTVNKVASRLKRGNEFVHQYKHRNEIKTLKVFKLKDLKTYPKTWETLDKLPNVFVYKNGTELVQRMNADKCEYCGRSKGYFEVHHIRKLSDIKDGKEPWQKLMTARSRKTLILCIECHDLLHAGKLPGWRKSIYEEVESRVL